MSDIAVRLNNLGKMYRLYRRQADKVLDAFGISRCFFWRKNYYQEFWALREISLEVRVGERLGIIGRNGAGKSTLLKILCGTVLPTEGTSLVNGNVQALLDLGTGFHPEFTGRQNIRASLALQGFSAAQIAEKESEIVEFAELDEFIDQPIKTYSAGMNARLAFSTATAVEPHVLIIDEVLGAGDAYFAGKCVERMRKLTQDSRITVLFVSHDLSSVQRLCDKAMWLERGRIRMLGPSLEVIKAYSRFIQAMEDRRLKATNRKRFSKAYRHSQLEGYADALVVSLQLQGESGMYCDVSEIALVKDAQLEEVLKIGDVQDSDWSHGSVLSRSGTNWSESLREGNVYFRRLIIPDVGSPSALGQAVFYQYVLFPESKYAFHLRYRCKGEGRLTISVMLNGSPIAGVTEISSPNTEWNDHEIPFSFEMKDGETRRKTEKAEDSSLSHRTWRSKWEGDGSLVIEKVAILGENDLEQTVFQAGSRLSLRMEAIANQSGVYDVLPVAVLFRLDGILLSNNQGEMKRIELNTGDRFEYTVTYDPLNLGDGYYVFSVALYKVLSHSEESIFYDLIDRSYQFQIVGNRFFNNGVFWHPAQWQLTVPRHMENSEKKMEKLTVPADHQH